MAQKHDILYVNFYTDGSAAKKVAPAFPASGAQKSAKPHRQKKKVIYVDPVAVFSLAVAAVLLIMMAVGLTQLQNAQAEAVKMESYVDTLTVENDRLHAQFRDDVDLQSVEQTAIAVGMIPKAQAQTRDLYVDAIRVEEPPQSFWQQAYTFLINLFA